MKKDRLMKSNVLLFAAISALMLACGAATPADEDGSTGTADPSAPPPPAIELVGEEFVPVANETARPGAGVYAGYDIIPIRGEYVMSKTNFAPVSFTSGEYVGGTTAADRRAFRMWFVIRKGTEFSGPMTYINLLDGGDYRLGSHKDEVENTLGQGSMLGAGNSIVAGNIIGTQCHFADNADNELYDIYYTVWNVGANRSIVNAGKGSYSINFHIEPRKGDGNTGADIPEGRLYTECPVAINVVSGGGGGDTGSGDFQTEEYEGCSTKSFSYTDKNLSMKVEVPANSTGKTPFLIYVTGGSWTGGSVGAFEKQSKYLATHGIAGVRVVYSYVKNGGNLQIGYDEMRAAYDYVAAKAGELNLDVTRFGYVGGSAGCTIAAYAAMTIPGCDLFVGCNGLYDLIDLQENNFPARNAESMKYLAPYSREQLSAMSPIRVIPATGTPAVALFHGKNDAVINYLRSSEFAKAVSDAGGRADLNLYENVGHGFFNSTTSGGRFKEVTLKMYEFAREVFGLSEQACRLDDECTAMQQ